MMLRNSRIRRCWQYTVPVVVAIAVGASAVACSSADDGPRSAATHFLSQFGGQHLDQAAAETDSPQRAAKDMAAAFSGLSAQAMSAEVGRAQVDGDDASVAVTYHWKLSQTHEWTYSGSLHMARSEGGWQVRWSSTDIHPDLGATQTLSAQMLPAPVAGINERDGSTVLGPGSVYRVSLNASAAQSGSPAQSGSVTQSSSVTQSGSAAQSASQLADVLRGIDLHLDAQKIAEESTSTSGDYVVATLSRAQHDRIADQLAAIAGVSTTALADLVPTDPKFAPDLMTQIKKEVGGELDGASGWRVTARNANGAPSGVLAEVKPAPSPSVDISLSRAAQNAAQNAVNARKDKQAMMVVLQASTGRILAIAQNPLSDKDGPIATTGLYPPGSTFKIVTAAATISSKLARPDTQVACPGTVTIGERTIPNYNQFDLGTVSLQTAFARSCNTTFAHFASLMGPSELANTAARMGIGPHYRVPGVPIASGSVPIAPELVSRSESGFGQGKDLTNPFGMAMAAATVAHGSAPVPQLILNRRTKVSGQQPPLDRQVIESLRPMMREVVVDGTGASINKQGEIYGKTGEAEYPGGSHAWFAGYRGDLAFATLIVGGQSSDNAVEVTSSFFSGLPSGYLG